MSLNTHNCVVRPSCTWGPWRRGGGDRRIRRAGKDGRAWDGTVGVAQHVI